MMYENWAKYDEVSRYYPFNPVDDIEIYRDKVKHWISNYESGSYFHWVIEWKETGELIGTINLGNVEEACHMCDTCYMLSPGFWNKGIMTEVLEAVLDYAFDRVGFNRVQAEVFYGNDASSAVLKKCGMVLEGVARQKYCDKVWYDHKAIEGLRYAPHQSEVHCRTDYRNKRIYYHERLICLSSE